MRRIIFSLIASIAMIALFGLIITIASCEAGTQEKYERFVRYDAGGYWHVLEDRKLGVACYSPPDYAAVSCMSRDVTR